MAELVVGIEGKPERVATWPFSVRTKPLSRHKVTGSRSTKGFLDRSEIVLGRVGLVGAPCTSGVLGPETDRGRSYNVAHLRPLRLLPSREADLIPSIRADDFVLGGIPFLELRSERSPHVEGWLRLELGELENALIKAASVVFRANDLDTVGDSEAIR